MAKYVGLVVVLVAVLLGASCAGDRAPVPSSTPTTVSASSLVKDAKRNIYEYQTRWVGRRVVIRGLVLAQVNAELATTKVDGDVVVVLRGSPSELLKLSPLSVIAVECTVGQPKTGVSWLLIMRDCQVGGMR